jgi:hypothetical protein
MKARLTLRKKELSRAQRQGQGTREGGWKPRGGEEDVLGRDRHQPERAGPDPVLAKLDEPLGRKGIVNNADEEKLVVGRPGLVLLPQVGRKVLHAGRGSSRHCVSLSRRRAPED